MDGEPPTVAAARSSSPGTLLRGALALATAGFLLAALALVFSKTMQRSLDHDEHQFVASAALHAREGLLPYRDFPHFHVPYLVFVYGWLFDATDHLLLAARAFSVACAWLTLLLVVLSARAALRPLGPVWGPGLTLACGVALLFNPLFVYTSGIAWNHDASVLLALGAFLLATRASAGEQPRTAPALAAGLLLGLSAGVRLTTLPLAAPFLLALWMPRRAASLRASVGFLGGLGLGLAPAFALFATAPAAAWFGNISYARLNTAYREATGFDAAMDLPGKARYVLETVLAEPASVALLATCALALLLCLRAGPAASVHDQRRRRCVLLLLLSLPFALLGSLAPTPSWYQYYYAPVPLLVVGLAAALGSLGAAPVRRTAAGALLAVAAALAVATGLSSYRTLSNLTAPESWIPSRVHAVGERLDALAPPGPVLTVSPIFPLEGGRAIYPALASGPFAFRSGPLMTAQERAEHGLLALEDFGPPGGPPPPAAVITGHDKKTDPALDAWATERGMERVDLPGGERVYLADR